jgi:hypothetical protein
MLMMPIEALTGSFLLIAQAVSLDSHYTEFTKYDVEDTASTAQQV